MAKGYAEALALVEAGKQIGMTLVKAADDKRPERSKPEKKEKPPSWEQLWLEEQQRRAKFDDFMKVMKKQLADEPKKDDNKKISDTDKIVFLMLISPLLGALSLGLLKALLQI